MSIMFSPFQINALTIKNRFVRSATWEGLATDEGAVTPAIVSIMSDLAQGGVGLIISSHAYASSEGKAGPWQLALDKDELIPSLKIMTDAVHAHGSKTIAQLAHAGKFGATKLTGVPPLVVSDVEGMSKHAVKVATEEDIESLVKSFADAAERAMSAGFDGLQIHAAHGYLLSQFLSPIFNKRKDQYGGGIENRARIHSKIITEIRKKVGPSFPILVKLNCADFAEGGLTMEESLKAAFIMKDAGLDALEISGGLLTGGKLSPSRPNINTKEKELYYRQEVRYFRDSLKLPLIVVGGFRSFEVSEEAVKSGLCDFVSMSRPLIREPNLVNRWKSGNMDRARCISDNLCFKPAMAGEGLYCYTDKFEKKPAAAGSGAKES